MSAAAADPPPPPPHGNGGSGQDGHRRPRRSIQGVLVEGDSGDEAYNSDNEADWPCITCLNSARKNIELDCVPTASGTCSTCKRKKKTCVYEPVMFGTSPRLRRTTTRMIELIRSGGAIEVLASGTKRIKGYKFPVPSVEFSRAVLCWNAALEWTRANPKTGQDAYAANVAESSPAAAQSSNQATPSSSQTGPLAAVWQSNTRGRTSSGELAMAARAFNGLAEGLRASQEDSRAQTAAILALQQQIQAFQQQMLTAITNLSAAGTPSRRAIAYYDDEDERGHSSRSSRRHGSSRRRSPSRRQRSRSPESPSPAERSHRNSSRHRSSRRRRSRSPRRRSRSPRRRSRSPRRRSRSPSRVEHSPSSDASGDSVFRS